MTPRRVVTAALAFLGLIGILLIPSPSGAATRLRVPRVPRVTTTSTTVVVADDQAPADQANSADQAVTADPAVTADDAGSPQAVIVESTVPGFHFPSFTFGGITFPGFTIPAITIPDFPGSDAVAAGIQQVLNNVLHTLCTLLGGSFCASA